MTNQPPPIIWLASYPKSGNTWIRFLLYCVRYGAPKKSLDIARKIPDIHRPLPLDPPAPGEPMFCKTHYAFARSHPQAARTSRAILIIRNPRDVLFSALNFRRLAGLSTERMSDAQYASRFISAAGDPEFKALGYGSWISHARSWKLQNDFPVLTIRYEDLKANPEEQLANILGFVGWERDQSRINQAVRESSFDSMRALEIREKHQHTKDSSSQSLFVGTEDARKQGTYFMNKGKSRQSLASIDPALEEAFAETFAQPMKELGYEP